MAITGVGNWNTYEGVYISQKKEPDKGKDVSDISGQKETENTEKSRETDHQNYLAKLQEKVSYLELEQGCGLSMTRDNRTSLTIHPKLLEKMQNDPEAEKKYTQTIKDIERAERTATAYYNALGGCVERTSHWYMDENGKYCHFAYTRRDDRLNKMLRAQAKENMEKRIEKTRENARKKAKELAEKLEEKADKKLSEKLENTENRDVILNETETGMLVETIKEMEEIEEHPVKTSEDRGQEEKEITGKKVDIRV